MSRDFCLVCKGGRLLCGLPTCPLLRKVRFQSPIEERLREEIFGPSPSIFVGWRGYPETFAGPLTSVYDGEAALLDDPSRWYGLDFDEIIRLRSSLVRSKAREDARKAARMRLNLQEVALSTKPVDTEVRFKTKPRYGISFSPVSQPMGPTGILERFEIASNPVIPKRVDQLVQDEVRATEAVRELYRSGYDVYYLARVLSSGSLGKRDTRRLVPTRWSITATDDMIGRSLIQEIKNYPLISEHMVFHNTYLENHFEILLLPSSWEFEQFEAWAPNTLWTMSLSEPKIVHENERYKGRTDYALKEGGGYYAGRLAVLEALAKMRRQAAVCVFRETYEGYVIPVGVWEVRENVRRAMSNAPERFPSQEEALKRIKSRLRIDISQYVAKSETLAQRRLLEFKI